MFNFFFLFNLSASSIWVRFLLHVWTSLVSQNPYSFLMNDPQFLSCEFNSLVVAVGVDQFGATIFFCFCYDNIFTKMSNLIEKGINFQNWGGKLQRHGFTLNNLLI